MLPTRCHRAACLIIVWSWLIVPRWTICRAQEATDDPATSAVSADVVRSRLQDAEANQNLEESVRTQVAETYRRILTDLEAAKSVRESRQKSINDTAEVPAKLDELNRQLESGTDAATLPDTSGYTQEQLDKQVSQLQVELSNAQAKLSQLQAEPKRRSERSLAAPQEIADLLAARAELEKQKARPADRETVASELREAERMTLDVRLSNIDLKIAQIKDELAYYSAADELLNKRIEVAENAAERTAVELKKWVDEAERRRRRSAAVDIQEKKSAATEVPDELKSMARENVELSEQFERVVHEIDQATEQMADARKKVNEYGDQLLQAQQLIDAQAGVGEAVGNALREQRQQLPDARQLHGDSQNRRKSLYQLRSDEFTISEKLRQFADFDERLKQEVDRLSQLLPADRVKELEPQIRSLLEARQKTLQELQQNYRTYLDKLVNLNIHQQALTSLVQQYTQFIDERILWIRSVPPVSLDDLRAVPRGLTLISSAQGWRELWVDVLRQVKQRAVYHLAIGVLLLCCVGFRSYGIGEIRRLGDVAKARGCRDFEPTVKAFLWTVTVSAAGPVLLTWVAWILDEVANNQASRLAGPLASAAHLSAIAYWPLSFWMNTVRRKGLAESHFGWSTISLSSIRTQLTWFVPLSIFLSAGYSLYHHSRDPELERSLSRFFLLALMISVAVFFRFIFSPRHGAVSDYLARHPEGWLYRTRFIWFSLVLGVPLSFALQTLMGYQYTAERLTIYLFWTVVFLSGMYMIEALALRWILVTRRRLAIAQAKERLRSGGPPPDERESNELQGGVTEKTQVNLKEVDKQTKRLVSTFVLAAAAAGMFFIWVEALPAIARLNDVRLWRYDNGVAASATGDAVAKETVVGEKTADRPESTLGDSDFTNLPVTSRSTEGWITLGNLLGSLVIATLTYVAVRNIPGLLEIVVLQHLPLDASLRYAITTVTRYALIIAGTGWAFTNVGFGWSKIQWLAAAVSVGLGFGLQEIFANFVSGLILLFERPLRAGDIVTVGDVTGTVVQIRTRATTIRDWDRKELVVPNKEFITRELLNWTLTDEINRLIINVGVAYGSDIKQVREMILDAAVRHPLVLEDPAPTVTFEMFGDSSLNFTLRCFLATIDDRLPVKHELHEAIYDALTAAGVTIPFPQRDVHLFVESNGSHQELVRPDAYQR